MAYKYTEAIEYFNGEHDGLCEQYNDTDNILQMLESLMEAGIEHIDVEIDDDVCSGALYLTLPKTIPPELVVELAYIHPDEISLENKGTIRIWWD